MQPEPTAPIQVARNTLITCLTSAMLVGIYDTFKREAHSGLLALSAAVNSGIAGATFFSVREFIISPILVSALPWRQYQYRKHAIESLPSQEQEDSVPERALTWWDVRSYKLLDTAISGALSGGVLNSMKRGRPGIVPGIVTGAMFCTALQLGFNEFSIARINWAARRLDGIKRPPAMLPTPPKSFPERILTTLGFKKISDDAYVTRLKQTREYYLKRIQELEQETQRERADDNDNDN